MLHNKPHLTTVHAKVKALHLSEVCKFQPTSTASKVELDSAVQCGALTSLMAITAAIGGMLAFKKLGFIHMFPEQLHGTLKWIHRNVGDFFLDKKCSDSKQQLTFRTLLQLGLLTYIAALSTIELALKHAAVYKVCCQPFATILSHMTLQPHMY